MEVRNLITPPPLEINIKENNDIKLEEVDEAILEEINKILEMLPEYVGV